MSCRRRIPRAVRSREDLLRVNAWMGNCGIMARALRSAVHGHSGPAPGRAGRRGREIPVARRAAAAAGLAGHATRCCSTAGTSSRRKPARPLQPWAGARKSWKRRRWLGSAQPAAHGLRRDDCEPVPASLPRGPTGGASARGGEATRVFIAVEPRRSGRGLFFSRLLWLIGCNQVTRHDAPVSVRAGFAGLRTVAALAGRTGLVVAGAPGGLVQPFVHCAAAGNKPMPALKPITIVGGGLAGLTLGIGLRQQGIPVTVWEAGHYPRHRVCGEFISGRGQDVLARLGSAGVFSPGGSASSPARPRSFWAGPLRPCGPCRRPRCACRASPWTRCWPSISGEVGR